MRPRGVFLWGGGKIILQLAGSGRADEAPAASTAPRGTSRPPGTMTDKQRVAESIKHSISKAGFPGKAVRLPFRPVFASCKEHGTSLGEVLEQLREDNVFGQVKGDHIEFRATAEESRSPSPEESGAQPPKDFETLTRQAMAHITPEQLATIREQVEGMSEEEKKNLLKMFSENFKIP